MLCYLMKGTDLTRQSYSMIRNTKMLEKPCYIYKQRCMFVAEKKRRKRSVPYQNLFDGILHTSVSFSRDCFLCYCSFSQAKCFITYLR